MKKDDLISSDLAKSIKKVVAVVSIITLSIAALIGIGYILKFIPKESKIIGSILLTLLTLFLGALLSLNSVEGIRKQSPLGYISWALILISDLMFLIQVWLVFFGISNTAFLKAIVIVGAFSVFFSALVSKLVILGPKLIIIQIIGYLSLLVLLSYISFLVIKGIDSVNKLFPSFIIIDLIICLVMFIILSVNSKVDDYEQDISSDTIILSTKEYKALLDDYDLMKKKVEELQEYIKDYLKENK